MEGCSSLTIASDHLDSLLDHGVSVSPPAMRVLSTLPVCLLTTSRGLMHLSFIKVLIFKPSIDARSPPSRAEVAFPLQVSCRGIRYFRIRAFSLAHHA